MAKNKKKSFQKREHVAEPAREIDNSTATESANEKTENSEGNAFVTFLFGHPKINKKDIIEVVIAITFIALLVFMQLKQNDII